MKISGHKSRSGFDRYDVVDERDLKNADRKLDDYIQSLPTQPPAGHTLGTPGAPGQPEHTDQPRKPLT